LLKLTEFCHCERKRSNPALNASRPWIASSLSLLAMTQPIEAERDPTRPRPH
jgi:hypothetical protein